MKTQVKTSLRRPARDLARLTLLGALAGAAWGWWATRTTDELDRIKGWG